MLKTYDKLSFDRFGDDMCELVLSYLPFEDKKRFECVSKQWRRSVYQNQYILTMDEMFFKRLKKSDALGNESMNFNAFKFSDFTKLIDSVVKHSKHLKQIECDFVQITDDRANKFFIKFGPKLTKIQFYIQENILYGRNFCINGLKSCTNLSELNIMYLSLVFYGSNNCLAKNLKKFTFCYFNWDTSALEKFIEHNWQTLECIEVYLPRHIQPIPVTVLLEQLTRLTQLKSLKIVFLDYYSFSIVGALEEIASKCKKLEKVQLRFFSELLSLNIDIFNTFKHFKQLKALDLSLYTGITPQTQLYLSSESLSECKCLTALTLRANQYVINDSFFVDIDKHLPKLRSLDVWNANINGLAFDSLVKMKYLKHLYLSSYIQKQIMESRVYELIEENPFIRIIELENFETLDYQEVEGLLKADGEV